MAVKTSDLKEWGIVKKLNDMMCDELFGPEKTVSDDLVKRLRVNIHTSVDPLALTNEAADRIEALEKRNKELEAALRNCCDKWENGNGICEWLEAVDEARAALGEKKDD